MIRLIPYLHTEFTSNLTHEEAVECLSGLITPCQSLPALFRTEGSDYSGRVSAQGFRMTRDMRRHNSLNPTIYGKFIPLAENRVQVDLRVLLNPLALVSGIVLGALSFFYLGYLLLHPAAHGALQPAFLPTLGFLAFLYVMLVASFNMEVENSVAFLKDRLQTTA
jgi:hypothetical protein